MGVSLAMPPNGTASGAVAYVIRATARQMMMPYIHTSLFSWDETISCSFPPKKNQLNFTFWDI